MSPSASIAASRATKACGPLGRSSLAAWRNARTLLNSASLRAGIAPVTKPWVNPSGRSLSTLWAAQSFKVSFNASRVHCPQQPSSQVRAKQRWSLMVCGLNSRQSVLAGTEVVKPDGRFNTDVVLLSSGATSTFFDRTLSFGAGALRLLGFFLHDRCRPQTHRGTLEQTRLLSRNTREQLGDAHLAFQSHAYPI